MNILVNWLQPHWNNNNLCIIFDILGLLISMNKDNDNDNDNDNSNDDNDDNALGAIGFMFDAIHEKIKKEIVFDNDITIVLNTIGDDPGHVQSGQYVWPASIASGQYYISINDTIQQQCNSKEGCVLELGAGCGLAGLVMSKLESINTIIFTDYDHGTLKLLHENIIINSNSNNSINTTTNSIQYIDDNNITKTFIIDYLEWGKDIPQWNHYVNIIIGADLLYCSDVVEPLIKTISKVFHNNDILLNNNTNNIPKKCLFILISSFDTGDDVDDEMIRCLHHYGFKSTTIQELSTNNNSCKIQHIEIV